MNETRQFVIKKGDGTDKSVSRKPKIRKTINNDQLLVMKYKKKNFCGVEIGLKYIYIIYIIE